MIDYDDGDDFWLASLFTPGGFGLLLLVVAMILWVVAFNNEQDCRKLSCAKDLSPVVMRGECLCIARPVPTNETKGEE
jgi:hypothetical protein